MYLKVVVSENVVMGLMLMMKMKKTVVDAVETRVEVPLVHQLMFSEFVGQGIQELAGIGQQMDRVVELGSLEVALLCPSSLICCVGVKKFKPN